MKIILCNVYEWEVLSGKQYTLYKLFDYVHEIYTFKDYGASFIQKHKIEIIKIQSYM